MRKDRFDKIEGDKSDFDLIKKSFMEINRILKEGCHFYCFCSWHNIDLFKQEFEKIFELKNILIWEKNGGYIGDLDCQYGVNYEFILFGYKRWYEKNKDESKKDYTSSYLDVKDIIHRNFTRENINWNDSKLIDLLISNNVASSINSAKTILKHKFDYSYKQFELLTQKQYEIFKPLLKWDFAYESIYKLFKGDNRRKQLNGKREGSILKYNKVNNNEYIHPTQKPQDLIEYLIKKSSNKNNLVCDPFMGSGTTAKACINTNRNYIGFEIDKQYCE
jgi:DNA modification methylase